MAEKYGFSPENKGAVDAALDFKRLKLKKGETARIAIFGIEEGEDGKKKFTIPAPEGGYYFPLENREGKYQGDYECLAPEEVKKADEYAPDVCPHCEAVMDGVSDEIVGKRRRRFVLPVFVYNTRGRGSEVLEPVGGHVEAWRFTDRYFNTLVDENQRWGNTGGLLKHDLSLFCEVEDFQNFKISVEPEAVWLRSPDISKMVVATYLEALKEVPNGLGAVLGRTLPAGELRSKIESTLGGKVAEISEEDAASIEDLAGDMFGGSQKPQEAPGEAENASVADVMPEVPTEAPAAPSEASGEAEAGGGESQPTEIDEMDFDSFFGSDS